MIYDGVEYREITPDEYDALLEEKRRNEAIRMEAVEEFRLWGAVNKGVDTVDELLRVCTAEELRRAVYDYARHYGASSWMNILENAVQRLAAKERLRDAELRAVTPEPEVPT